MSHASNKLELQKGRSKKNTIFLPRNKYGNKRIILQPFFSKCRLGKWGAEPPPHLPGAGPLIVFFLYLSIRATSPYASCPRESKAKSDLMNHTIRPSI